MYNNYCGEIDFSKTVIKKEVLRDYFREAYRDTKVIGAFFFENRIIESESVLPYHNKEHPLYSKRLNASIQAWNFINKNPDSLLNKTPKEAIQEYLINNSIELGFSEKFSNNDKSDLERISTVTSWLFGSEGRKYRKDCINSVKEKTESLYPKLKEWDYDLLDLTIDNKENSKTVSSFNELDDDIPF